jgi:hypothetical protein
MNALETLVLYWFGKVIDDTFKLHIKFYILQRGACGSVVG